MTEAKESVSAFAHRLGDLVNEDVSDQEVFITNDAVHRVRTDGSLSPEAGLGAEAILIVRGPAEGRKKAIARLLAEIDTR